MTTLGIENCLVNQCTYASINGSETFASQYVHVPADHTNPAEITNFLHLNQSGTAQ